MTKVTSLVCMVVWGVVGLLSGQGVTQEMLMREYQGHRSTESRPSTHPLDPTKELLKPDPLETNDLPFLNASNTSHTPPHSRPYKLEEVLNTSMLNRTSSYSSQTPSTFGSHNTYNRSEFHAPLVSSSGRTRRLHHHNTNSDTTASYISGSSHAPSLVDRGAGRKLHAPRNYVNFSLTNHYALPNWERPPRFLFTQGNYSRVYHLPSWESSLSLFGVQSSGQVRIALIHADTDQAPVNITLFGPEEESEIRFNLSRSGHVLVSPHKLRLTLDNYTWFTVFRKGHVVYVFLADKPDPFLVYEDVDSKLQLLHYTRFQVWSEGQAYWDFVGKEYSNENRFVGLSEKALTEELNGIKEGLAERFALITSLVSFLQRPDVVGNLTLPDIQEIRDIGETVVPLRNILYFYGMIDDKKMHWTAT